MEGISLEELQLAARNHGMPLEALRYPVTPVGLHYLLPELSLKEVKAIVERALGKEATAEVVAEIYNVTGAIHRHVDMILPRILDLKERNQDKLATGEVKMEQIVRIAGSRLMTGII